LEAGLDKAEIEATRAGIEGDKSFFLGCDWAKLPTEDDVT